MFDTIDGNFWKDFKNVGGKLYFDDKRNLGAILNIDWFKPFENIQFSCEVIYVAILNLPRELRFEWENRKYLNSWYHSRTKRTKLNSEHFP